MDGKMVVTNLRIDKHDWLQLKVSAAEQGMSVNEYVNFMIQDYAKKKQFPKKTNKKRSFYDLSKIAKIKDTPMGISKDDEVIYG